MKWEKLRLSSITTTLESGSRPKGGAVLSGIPSLGAEHLDGTGGFKFNKLKYVPKNYYSQMASGIIRPNDILIVKDGATTGKVSIVDHTFPFLEASINEHVFLLRVDPQKCNSKYCFYYLSSDEGQKELMADFRGATVGGISRNILTLIKVPLPPLQIQEQIADTLDKADALRRKDQELLQKYDQLAQAIFYDMFGDPTVNSKKLNIKSLGELIVNKSDLVDGPFGSSVNVKTDYVKDGEIPVIRTKNVGLLEFYEDDLMFMTREKYESVKRSQVLPGDIIITKVGTIGNISFFPNHLKEGVLSTTGSCRFRPTKGIINPTFLSYNLLYQRGYMKRIASEGVQPFLNMTHIKSIPVLYPDLNQQNLFERRIKKLEETVYASKKTAEYGSLLFNVLSSNHFS